MKENNIKNKWLHLRLSEDEYNQLQQAFSKTTERKISKYARNILLGKPVISEYRNLSAEDLLREFSILNKTLNGIANNYNQVVHKLHMLDHIPEVKRWLTASEPQGKMLFQNIEEIKDHLKKSTVKWLQ